MRQILLFFGLTVLVLIPFFIWGERWEERFTLEGAVLWLQDYGQWAWLAGIVLLVLDIILPVPGTLVMSGLGYVYGVFIGGIVAGLGSFISGAAGYWLCRSFGKGGAVKILGEKDFNRGTETFNRVGGWLVVLSRWLPVFPEVISCMAGLNRMSILKFHLALLVSSIPLGFVFAYIGSVGDQHPLATVILSIVLPVIIWLIVTPIFNRHRKTI